MQWERTTNTRVVKSAKMTQLSLEGLHADAPARTARTHHVWPRMARCGGTIRRNRSGAYFARMKPDESTLQLGHETIYPARPPTPQSPALEPSSIASMRSADSP